MSHERELSLCVRARVSPSMAQDSSTDHAGRGAGKPGPGCDRRGLLWGPVGPWCWKGLFLPAVMVLPVCHAMPGLLRWGREGRERSRALGNHSTGSWVTRGPAPCQPPEPSRGCSLLKAGAGLPEGRVSCFCKRLPTRTSAVTGTSVLPLQPQRHQGPVTHRHTHQHTPTAGSKVKANFIVV